MKKYSLLIGAFLALNGWALTSHAESMILGLKRGIMADYGATPWYTDNLIMGTSEMNFTLDTGTTLFWATTTECTNVACEAHPRVDVNQSGYEPIPAPGYPKTVSFGPWGSMQVKLAEIALNGAAGEDIEKVDFAASYQYSGSKFQYLSWGGGIGFPSETSQVDKYQTSFMRDLVKKGLDPLFSVTTDFGGLGEFWIGAESPKRVEETMVRLPAKKSTLPGLGYLWGTNLIAAKLGETYFPNVSNSLLFLDTGSSRFKARSQSILPILNEFLKYTYEGEPIFTKIIEEGQFVGLQYANGKNPTDYQGILPEFTLNIGDMCKGKEAQSLVAGLSPLQYSYYVQEGDRAESWVLAFHILEGVDGLLVGSTFLDNVVATFEHVKGTGDDLSQGDMYLYQKSSGTNLATYKCAFMAHAK